MCYCFFVPVPGFQMSENKHHNRLGAQFVHFCYICHCQYSLPCLCKRKQHLLRVNCMCVTQRKAEAGCSAAAEVMRPPNETWDVCLTVCLTPCPALHLSVSASLRFSSSPARSWTGTGVRVHPSSLGMPGWTIPLTKAPSAGGPQTPTALVTGGSSSAW